MKIKVMDILGNRVRIIQFTGYDPGNIPEKLDLTDLPPGIYLAEIASDSQVWIEKLIIQ
jgi:hypothetical protein